MNVNNIVDNQMATAMQRIAGGQQINSASDNAAGLAITEGMESMIRGLNQGIDNTRDMQNLTNTAEGGLNNIGDGLQRIRELSIQAANGTNTQADRERIQFEITEIVDNISATARNTQFNNMPLLDGSFQGQNTASAPDGTGVQVNIADMGDIANTIANMNVSEQTGLDGSFQALDAALADVSGERAALGAVSNRFDATIENNAVAAENLAVAQSQIRDADIAEEVTDLQQAQVLNEVQLLMQQQQQEVYEQEQLAPVMAAAI